MEHKKSYSNIICNFGCDERPDPTVFERHCHPYYEILYVKSGEGKYVVESAEYPLAPDSLILIRPYEFHYVCPSKDAAYERFLLQFPEEMLFNDTLRSFSFLQTDGKPGKGAYFRFDNENKMILETLEKMSNISELFEGRRHRTEKEETMRLAFLSQVLLYLSLEEHESKESDDDLLNSIIEYINYHLDGDINLDKISQKFFISKYYLCRAFKERTGVSLITYLNTKRTAMADELIKRGEPPTSVAYQVGFKTYTSFYRAFCKYMGHPPMRSRGEGEIVKQ